MKRAGLKTINYQTMYKENKEPETTQTTDPGMFYEPML